MPLKLTDAGREALEKSATDALVAYDALVTALLEAWDAFVVGLEKDGASLTELAWGPYDAVEDAARRLREARGETP